MATIRPSENIGNIENLKEALSLNTGHTILFFDIVSVEKKDKKKYDVLWFGENEAFLHRYHDLINKFFYNNVDRKSLLFLECDNSSGNNKGVHRRHIAFSGIQSCLDCKEVDLSTCLTDNFVLQESGTGRIQKSDENIYFDLWQSEILSPCNIRYASFSKIEFQIRKKEFIAAIWVGYTGNVSSKLDDEGFRLHLENFLWSYAVDSIASELIDETEQQATRAAISQVGARNGSHNIGSHVLNNLSVYERLKSINVNAFKSYQSSPVDAIYADILNQLAVFNNYVKCRMDYLNDITYGIPSMQTNSYVYKELFLRFDSVRLLLEYISGLSENFKYRIINRKNGQDVASENDFAIGLPNDIIGAQAFYNILENIIRNTAKHNQDKHTDTIFYVDFKDIDMENTAPQTLRDAADAMYAVEVYDNNKIIDDPKVQNDNDNSSETPSLIHPILSSGAAFSGKKINHLVKNQNDRLNESVLNSSYQLRFSSLGLLEMEASAAYLRRLDVIDIENENFKIENNVALHNSHGQFNILKAINVNGALGYRFFVYKPTEFLFLGDFSFISSARRQQLQQWGITLITIELLEAKLMNSSVFTHQFLICNGQVDTINNLRNQYNTSLPTRVIILNEKNPDVISAVTNSNSNFQAIEEIVWGIWFEQIKGEWHTVNLFTGFSAIDHDHSGHFNIAFSDHLETWGINLNLKDSGKIRFLEALSSLGVRTLPKFNHEDISYYVGQLDNNSVVLSKLFEAANNKILVIDERVQQFASTPYRYKNCEVPYNDIFKATGIVVPEVNCHQLDPDNFSQQRTASLCGYIEKEINNYAFVLIHFSILERMFGNSFDNKVINELLEKWATKTEVVVTTGRGRPRFLTTKVRYINLSPVLNVFMHARSKYAINYLLSQARR